MSLFLNLEKLNPSSQFENSKNFILIILVVSKGGQDRTGPGGSPPVASPTLKGTVKEIYQPGIP